MTTPERVTLADGRSVTIRPISHDDLGALRTAIEHADPDTLRRRFLGGSPPTGERLVHLVDVDQHVRAALVAETDDGDGVAVARYEPTTEPGVAESAVVVDPRWRGVGLGTAILTRLAAGAAANGYHAFRAAYLADNVEVERLVRASGLHAEVRIADGVADALLVLPGTLRAGTGAPPP